VVAYQPGPVVHTGRVHTAFVHLATVLNPPSPPSDALPEVSVVIPLLNEEETVPHLVEAVARALDGGMEWELILVDDGSSDGTVAAVAAALESRGGDPRIRLLRLARNYGQTAALQAGFDHARATVVVSMDGDLQNDPEDIPRLMAKLEEGYDLVAGYRRIRQDPLVSRRLPSQAANGLIRMLTGVPIRDTGCALKAYRRDLLSRIRLYSDLHRFTPAVAAATAGARITEIPVRHHPRRMGQSKYGMSRVAKVMADLILLRALRSFRDRPFAPFAISAMGALGLALVFGLLSLQAFGAAAPEVARSLVFPGISAILLGLSAYLLMLGLMAEIISERWARSPVEPGKVHAGGLR
jgi:hypothetical protein